MKHLDETGKVCERHAAVSDERMHELAVLGSRTSGFHHDAASKLQSLVMALDEIGELADEASPELRAELDTAHGALRDLHALLNDNRGLAKPPQLTLVKLRDVVARAAQRVGVRLRGEPGDADVRVAVPLMTHGIELLLDLVGGASSHGRIVELAVAHAGDRVRLALSGPAGARPAARADEVFAFAAYAVHRNQGELTCLGDDKVVVELPLARA
ncbi:MAG: hypothetical protein ACM31C_25305 [Acidobacteriota bacterium]